MLVSSVVEILVSVACTAVGLVAGWWARSIRKADLNVIVCPAIALVRRRKGEDEDVDEKSRIVCERLGLKPSKTVLEAWLSIADSIGEDARQRGAL